MYDYECQDLKTGRIFHKVFNDEREARRFATRCNHGKKILILSVVSKYGFDSWEDYDYIMGY